MSVLELFYQERILKMNYLIAGTSNYLINEEIKKIIGSEEYTKIDYIATTIDEIIVEASYNDLFGSKKNIIVKNANLFSEKNESATKKLEKYLENSNPNTTLIFVCEKANERLKIVSTMKEKYHAIILKTMYANDAAYKIMEEVKKRNFTISYEDARYIIDTSLNNFDIAMNNIDKICLYYNTPCKIKSNDVKELTSISIEDNQFKFVDAIITGNYRLAFKILKDFKIQKIEPFILFNMLAREYRNMLLIKEAASNSNTKNSILTTLNLQKWQQDKLLKNGANYTKKALENELVNLANIDLDIKLGRIDKYLALEMYVINHNA